MRTLLFVLLGALSLPALALTCQNPDLGPSTVVAPPVTGLWTMQIGYRSNTSPEVIFPTPEQAETYTLDNTWNITYGAGNALLCSCIPCSQANGQCNHSPDPGFYHCGFEAAILGAPNNSCATSTFYDTIAPAAAVQACPAGYTQSGSTCTSKVSQDEDSAAASSGGSINRNSDGNVTSMSVTGGATINGTSFDANKLLSSATLPDSTTVSYTYYPGTAQVFTQTDSRGTSIFLWRNAIQLAMVITPTGIFQPLYQTSAAGVTPVTAESGFTPNALVYDLIGMVKPGAVTITGVFEGPQVTPIWPDINTALPAQPPGCQDPLQLAQGNGLGPSCSMARAVCAHTFTWGDPKVGMVALGLQYQACLKRFGC